MQKVVLPNGLTVIFEYKPGASVVVEVMLKVGSDQEQAAERGIAHFLEHLLFEGTQKRPSNWQISNEIEKIGGDFNAYTTNERTCFYVKVLKKHFIKAVEVLADIVQHSLFKEEHISKEKNIVLKEIDMVFDDPKFYQWVILQKNLFVKHPCRHPTFGDKAVIRGLTRQKIISFFQKYYVPSNMVISVVGDVVGWKAAINRNFTMNGAGRRTLQQLLEPVAKKNKIVKERKNIVNTYTVLGFKTVPRSHADSYALEVINGILGRGQSGRMFTEIRSKFGLAYDVGTQCVLEASFGYFAIYATIDRKNWVLVRELIVQELQKLQHITVNDLREAQEYIEGDYLLGMEDTQKVADQLLFWEQVKDATLVNNYIHRIQKVTMADVQRVAQKYFQHYTGVILAGK